MRTEEEVVPKEMPLSSSSSQLILRCWQFVFSCAAFCPYHYTFSQLEVILLRQSVSGMNWLCFSCTPNTATCISLVHFNHQ